MDRSFHCSRTQLRLINLINLFVCIFITYFIIFFSFSLPFSLSLQPKVPHPLVGLVATTFSGFFSSLSCCGRDCCWEHFSGLCSLQTHTHTSLPLEHFRFLFLFIYISPNKEEDEGEVIKPRECCDINYLHKTSRTCCCKAERVPSRK